MKNQWLIFSATIAFLSFAQASTYPELKVEARYRAVLNEGRPQASKEGAFTMLVLSQPQIAYVGYTKEIVCIKIEEGDEGQTYCTKEQTEWLPTVEVSMNSKIFWGFGLSFNHQAERRFSFNLNKCLVNQESLKIVSETQPQTVPAQITIKKECLKNFNPIFTDVDSSAKNNLSPKYVSLMTTKLDSNLVVTNGQIANADLAVVPDTLLNTTRVNADGYYKYRHQSFISETDENVVLIDNYAH